MPAREITWQVPEGLYRELLWAQEELVHLGGNPLAVTEQAPVE